MQVYYEHTYNISNVYYDILRDSDINNSLRCYDVCYDGGINNKKPVI